MTKTEVRLLMQKINATYPQHKQLKPEQADSWYTVLKDSDYNQVMFNFQKFCMDPKHTFPPSIGELLEVRVRGDNKVKSKIEKRMFRVNEQMDFEDEQGYIWAFQDFEENQRLAAAYKVQYENKYFFFKKGDSDR